MSMTFEELNAFGCAGCHEPWTVVGRAVGLDGRDYCEPCLSKEINRQVEGNRLRKEIDRMCAEIEKRTLEELVLAVRDCQIRDDLEFPSIEYRLTHEEAIAAVEAFSARAHPNLGRALELAKSEQKAFLSTPQQKDSVIEHGIVTGGSEQDEEVGCRSQCILQENEEEGLYHYKRECKQCAKEWWSLHSACDLYQTPCAHCGYLPEPLDCADGIEPPPAEPKAPLSAPQQLKTEGENSAS